MIRKLKINRFKSLRDVECELGKINLFIGGNGSGKSNVLESIGVLSSAMSRGVADPELARKGVRLTPPALMKSAFKYYNLPKTFRIETELSNSITYDLELSASEANTALSIFSERATKSGVDIFGRSMRGSRVSGVPVKGRLEPYRGIWDQTKNAFDVSEDIREALDDLSKYAIYSPQTEFLRGIESSHAADPPVGLHGEGLALAVKSLLAHWGSVRSNKNASDENELIRSALNLVGLPGWASGVKVGKIDPSLKSKEMTESEGQVLYFIDRYMHAKRNTLSAYDSSEGTLFLLFISVLLAHPDSPKIFALDNVDNALNPSITRSLIERMISVLKMKEERSLNSGPDQIFLTSHNPTSLDAFDLFDDEQRVFVVSRDDKGQTQLDRLKPAPGWTREDWERIKEGRKLSQLWIDGEIDGALGEHGLRYEL